MKSKLTLALILAFSCPLAHAAHYKLFVLTGQSNSLGTTNAGEADPTSGSDPADSHVKFFWNNIGGEGVPIGDSDGDFTTLQDQQGGHYSGSATHWGPEINFGRTLYRAGVRDFGIIKASRGGGGNSFWLKSATDHHMYNHVVNTVTTATDKLTANGDTFEIVGLLYLQGESDSPAEAAAAGNNFKTLVDNLRTDLPAATGLFGMIGGIARPGATSDTVRANHSAIATSTSYIDFFSNLDLQAETAADNLHFNKAAKLKIGDRFAQAFFAAGTVARHYGKLVFIGDSITQGGNGDHPSYRYSVFKHLANQGVPLDATTGYKFTGSVTGPYQNSPITAPDIAGQVFENVHDGHYGWRVSWENARVALPAGRYNINNLGNGSLLNWTAQSATFETANAGTLAYTGITYTPDTASIMIGINDLADGVAATQVRDDIGTLIDQLRASNPNVRIHLNRILHTNQGAGRDTQVDTLNALLPALVASKNSASTTSPIWLVDADTGFDPATQTYDNIHPNASGETYVGDRIAASLGLLETPDPADSVIVPQPPPHLESGSIGFPSKFEGNEIWDGSAFLNGWSNFGNLTKSLPTATDFKAVNPGGGAAWIEGTNSGWNAMNHRSWTFETRLKFDANTNGFILWLGTDTNAIFVEIYGDRTQDTGNENFRVFHDNLDGNFHTFRIAHDAENAKYHVWRDSVRLTPLTGAAYDSGNDESRLILGDYTSRDFGNNFDATIDYVRYDQTAAFLPAGADADADGLPDSWEFKHFNTGGSYQDMVAAITATDPAADDDDDGQTNLNEYIANTDPKNSASLLKVESISSIGENTVVIGLNTSPQRNYTLQKSKDLGVLDPWTGVAGPTIGADGNLNLTDTNAIPPKAFYRVLVTIP